MIFKTLQVVQLKPGMLKMALQGDVYVIECWNADHNLRCTTDSQAWAQLLFDSLQKPGRADVVAPSQLLKEFD